MQIPRNIVATIALFMIPFSLPAQGSSPAMNGAQPSNLPVVAPVVDCTKLAGVDLSKSVGAEVQIDGAEVVDAGKPTAYCRVQATIENFAKFEVHLPVSSWTQRFLAGQPGSMSGFVTMSRSDIGHRGNEDAFADNAQLRINFAYRIVHLQVVASKALIAGYYNQAPKFSYWNACSEPGREGMMEVQRFPADFDGAVTGCPPINDTINNGLYEAWNIQTNTRRDGSLIITSDKLPLLHKFVLDECDRLDGAQDGLVSDPLDCHPKLTEAECRPGQDTSNCLTAEQIHVALELYRGAHDDKGNKLEPIGVLPGSEPQWTAVIAVPPPQPGRPIFANDRQGTVYALRSEFAYPALGKSWDLNQLKFDRADFDTFTKLHYLYDATNPDLTTFYKAGHKLIIWQGLADNNVLPAHTILYYTALQKTMGAQAVDKFVRLYLLPGVGHCGGGDGPSIRDFLNPLMAWVEKGEAPGALQASHVPQPPRGVGNRGPGDAAAGPGGPGENGAGGPRGQGGGFFMQGTMDTRGAKADLTRPVYPYPFTQKYIGKGDVRVATSFVQGPKRPAPVSLFTWWGADFYTPGYMKWCTGDGSVLECKSSQ